jgi:hypothetical protein
MHMERRSRWRSPAVWAMVAVLGLPALAEAQTMLIPHLPIRRKRVPCEAEAPVYKAYRQQYYGYFPTCWRRFPPGWGCPSPEAPNPSASLADQPIQSKPQASFDRRDTGMGLPDLGLPPVPDAGMGPGPGPEPGAEALPPVPRGGRSPFDLEPNPPADAPLVPRDRRAAPPGAGRNEPLPPVEPPTADGPRTEPIPVGSAASAARPIPAAPRRGLLAGLFGGPISR